MHKIFPFQLQKRKQEPQNCSARKIIKKPAFVIEDFGASQDAGITSSMAQAATTPRGQSGMVVDDEEDVPVVQRQQPSSVPPVNGNKLPDRFAVPAFKPKRHPSIALNPMPDIEDFGPTQQCTEDLLIDVIDDGELETFGDIEPGMMDDDIDGLEENNGKRLEFLGNAPKSRKRQPKPIANGLAAKFLEVMREETAARTFWTQTGDLPAGYINKCRQSEADAGAPQKSMKLKIDELVDEDSHLVPVRCSLLPPGRRATNRSQHTSETNTKESVTVIFTKRDFRKAQLDIGAEFQLFEPWVKLSSAGGAGITIMCPHFIKVIHTPV
ncbi:hypothetical protein BV898_05927 [Hypsibius exemplaris]|uniref:Uncharacterized protein n=1 Tax=Hypsibius exemplaris TaxID=2072580 RepID=A0A1W0WY54_HYPEX|nr:hypothetical protein BV898_05927 [Hypsibius exemplaris]